MPDTAGNSLATATPLTLLSTAQSYSDLVTPTANDFYRFSLENRSSFNLSLTGLDADANVALLDSAGNLVSVNGVGQTSTNQGKFAESINTTLDPGVYYIQVAPGINTPSANYTLTLSGNSKLESTDLIWRNVTTGEDVFWGLNPSYQLATYDNLLTLIPLDWRIAGTGDFNYDGQSDILWRYESLGLTVVWLMEGVNLIGYAELPPTKGSGWAVGGIADFNDDGQNDILWYNSALGQLDVWAMQGVNFVSSIPIAATQDVPTWSIGGVGDFNGDGNADILWRDNVTLLNEVWLLSGTSLISKAPIDLNLGGNWYVTGVADFDGDAKPDILWRDYSPAGRNQIWLLDGLTLSSAIELLPITAGGWISSPYSLYGIPDLIDIAGNTPASAFNLGTGLGQSATYRDRVGGLDSDDYYRFDITNTTQVSLFLSNLTGDVDLQLLDSSGNTILGSSSQTGLTPESLIRSLSTGTYYARVFPALGQTDSSYTLSVNITSPPVLVSNNPLTLDEEGSAIIKNSLLRVTDNDTPDSQLAYTVGNLTTNGRLLINGVTATTGTTFTQVNLDNSQVTYIHNGSETTSDRFSFTVSDGTGGNINNQTFSIQVNPVNDAPILVSNVGLTLSEGDSTVLSPGLLLISDVDSPAVSLQYSITNLPTNGTLLLAGTAANTFTQNDIFNGLVRYQHNGSESPFDRFTFTVTDGAILLPGSNTFSISVLPVNDAPAVSINTALTLSEGTSAAITPSFLLATDADGPAPVAYTLGSIPANGILKLGTATLQTGQTFTQLDITNGQLTYIHNGGETTSDRFQFTVTDGLGASSAATTFSISVLAVNDAPVLTAPSNLLVDQNTNTLISGISLTDVDLGDNDVTVSLSAGSGVLTLGRTTGVTFLTGDGTQDSTLSFRGRQDVANFVLQSLIYRSTGAFEGTDVVNIAVNDGGNFGLGGVKTDSKNVTLTVAGVNDAPVITAPALQTFSEDVTSPISGISIVDSDSGVNPLTVSLSVANGVLTLGSTSGLTITTGTGTLNKNLVFSGSQGAINAALAGLTYLSDRNYNGSDLLTMNVSDNGFTGNGIPLSASKLINLTITPVNDAPVITVPSSQSVNESTDLRISGISINDVDVSNGNLTVAVSAVSGLLSLDSLTGLSFTTGDGTQDSTLIFQGTQSAVNAALSALIYRPNANFGGADTISVSVSDGGNSGTGIPLSDSKSIAVNVLGVNNAPVIALPTGTPAVDSGINLTLSGFSVSDPDAGGGNLSVTVFAENGVLSLRSLAGLQFTQGTGIQNNRITFTGSIAAINDALSQVTYRSYPGFTNGFDRITLSVNDNGNTGVGVPLSDTKTLLVNVGNAVNLLPIATGDSFTVAERGTLLGTSVLANDSDPDFTLPLTAQLVSPPTNAGSFSFSPNGTFTYTPVANFNGFDTFSYVARDVLGGTSNTAIVVINVTSVNDLPVAVNDSFTTPEDQLVGGNVLANDTDADNLPSSLSAQLVSAPGNALSFSFNPNGSFSYTPTLNFNGADSFRYVAIDPLGGVSNTAIVSLTITPVNDAPVAVNDGVYTASAGGTLTVSSTNGILRNDTDVEGSALTATLVTAPTNGTVSLSSDGSFIYRPTGNFAGTDVFTYRASDGSLASNLATVTLSVGANNAPIANPNTFTLSENTNTTLGITGIERVSVASSGNEGLGADNVVNADYQTDISGDGRYVVFSTDAQGLVAGDTNSKLDVFLRDRQTGTTTLISTTVGTTSPNGDSYSPVISNDGRYVVFYSNAPDINAQGLAYSGLPGVYIYDRQTGITRRIAEGTVEAPGNGTNAERPAISSDGRFIAYETGSIIGGPGLGKIYVYDQQTGISTEIGAGRQPSISDDGRYIAFQEDFSEFSTQIFLYDRQTATTTPLADSFISAIRDISSDGRYTVFTSYSPNLVAGDTDTFSDVFVFDRQTGQTSRVSVASNGTQGNNNSFTATISADGRYVAFHSLASNLVAGDTNNERDVFVHDRLTGQTTRVSVGANGVEGDGQSLEAQISADGKFVSFASNATNLVNGDTNLSRDIFVATTDVSGSTIGNVLTNDTDVEGNIPLTASVIVSPANAFAFRLNPDGSFSYQPRLNFNGTDTFVYTATDSLGAVSNPTTVTLSVTPVNSAPVAFNDTVSVALGSILNITAPGILANDTDVDSASLTAVLVSSTSRGLLSLNPNGSFTYQPILGFIGDTDVFTYRASDGSLSSANTATVSIVRVAPLENNTPIAQPDLFTTAEDTLLTAGNVLTNDTDIDGNIPLTASVIAAPTNALAFTLRPDGSFSYQPTPNFSGLDTFTYAAIDSLGAVSSVAIATFSVTPVNDAPIAVNDVYSVNTTASLSQTAPGILANDSDIDSPSLTAVLVSNVQSGTLSLNSNGSFTYQPNAGFSGSDRFTYVANDGSLNSTNTATVNLFVTAGVNAAPIANPDLFTTAEDTLLTTGSVLTNDTDTDGNIPLTASVIAAPANALSFTLRPDGTFSYQPKLNITGLDTFTYAAIDSLGAVSSIAIATISVTPVNDAPLANNDAYNVAPGGTLNITGLGVLSNDTDIEGSPLTASLVTAPSSGTFTLNPDGSFNYVPQAGFSGNVSFTYVASDGVSVSNTAIATISVSSNAPPIAAPDLFIGAANTLLTTGNVLTNDTDTDGNIPLTASVITTPTNALSFTLNPDGSFSYQPTLNFSGLDTFTYAAIDSLGAVSSVAIATFSVTGGNNAPAALNDTYTVNAGSPLNITPLGILANDTDAEGSSLTASVVANPLSGSLTLNPNGSFNYTPNAGFFGSDRFTYVANDGQLNSTPATVSIRVNAIPVALPDTYTAVIGSSLTVALIDSILRNDTDADNPQLTATVVTAPTKGTLSLNPDGSFIYASTAGSSGIDTFVYRATDGFATSAPTTVTLSLRTNSAPIATNDSYRAATDGTLSVAALAGVLNNDTDAETSSFALTATLITGAQNGTVTLNSNGSFIYRPNSGYQGSDRFTYRATDGLLSSGLATVSLSVSPNTPPAVRNDNYLVASGVPYNQSSILQGVLANDSDAENNPLTASVVSAPGNGALTLNPNGTFIYTSNTGYQGTDIFTYRAFDGIASSTATVSISVKLNTPPTALPDTYTAIAGQTLTINNPGVLANDTDAEDPISAQPVSSPTQGTLVSFNANGSFVYVPNAGFTTGTDFFTYRATDGFFNTAPTTVTINVSPLTAVNDTYSVNRDNVINVPRTLGVLANDLAPNSTVAVVGNPTQGSLNLSSDGAFVYTPNAGVTGTDTFTYRATSGSNSSTAIVTLSIKATSAPPTAQNDSGYIVSTNGTLNITAAGVLTNDTDTDGDVIRTTLATAATNGSVSLNADGSFRYIPTTGFQGSDTFTYRATDGINLSAPATVVVTVGGANAAPVITLPGSQLAFRNTDLVIPSGLSISDVDAGSNSVTATLAATNGTLTLGGLSGLTFTTGDGTADTTMTFTGAIAAINTALTNLKFTPTTGYTGTAQIGLAVNDGGFTGTGGAQTGNGTVSINVSSGATLVANISPGATSSNPANLSAVGNLLYFAADDSTTGTEPWKSDGTSTATLRVTDINPAASASSPSNFTVVGNTVYFTATNSSTGRELWKTDLAGTSATLVNDVRLGTASSNPSSLVNFNNTLFFQANDGPGIAIFQIDGSGNPVKLVTSPSYTAPGNLTVVGNTLYFTANGATQLWKTDGTSGNTVLVKDLGSGAQIQRVTAVGNTVFFTAVDSGGTELWRSDGTAANTARAADLNPGSASSTPSNLVNVNGTLYFFARDAAAFKLWQSNAGGTVSLVATLPSAGQLPANLVAIGSKLFFTVDAGTAGSPDLQLWSSDGVSTATLVKNINSGGNDTVASLTNFNGSLYFTANDGTGNKVFRTDGTSVGTVAVSSNFSSTPTGLTVVNGKLFFAASDATNGTELWAVQ